MAVAYESDRTRLETYMRYLEQLDGGGVETAKTLCVNPHLQLFEMHWRHLWSLMMAGNPAVPPEKGAEQVMMWRHPFSGAIHARAVTPEDLLVMKMAVEEISSQEVARLGNTCKAAVDGAVVRALDTGVLMGPPPDITRPFAPTSPAGSLYSGRPRMFTLQWHITQACDLHCRHCYDRTAGKELSLDKALGVLEAFDHFCIQHGVYGQVTFTGGNPLLHPGFEVLYQRAADHGFTTSILGNPTSRNQLERIVAIQPPAYYQVSLEGLADHNDYMRGQGHFDRSLAFLELLREMNVYSMVMLTLTRANLDQVIPLGKFLAHRVDRFTFNRLSPMGEGKTLDMVDTEAYALFLERYMAAAETNPCLAMKDNLFNILLEQKGLPRSGGCTGHGCGAAYNFVSLLADGDVHACRKFPSRLGSLLTHSLEELFSSPAARRYRQGPLACKECSLRWDCRGCMAVAHGSGLDVFTDKDPFCFI